MNHDLTQCAGTCGRTIRPKGTKASDYPDTPTLLVRAIGMCNTCYRDVEPVRKRPAECIHCEVPMRPHGTDEEDWPGTDQHHGHGMCNGCWKRASRGTPPRTKEQRIAWEKDGKRAAQKRAAHLRVRKRPAPVKNPKRRGRVEIIPEITDPGLLKMRRDREERVRRQGQIQRARIAQEAARARFIASRRGVAA